MFEITWIGFSVHFLVTSPVTAENASHTQGNLHLRVQQWEQGRIQVWGSRCNIRRNRSKIERSRSKVGKGKSKVGKGRSKVERVGEYGDK